MGDEYQCRVRASHKSTKKRDRNRRVVEESIQPTWGVGISAGKVVGMEVRYPRTGCGRCPPLPTVKWGICHRSCPFGFRIRPESCPRAEAPQFSPATSFLAPNWLLPISDSQVQAPHSPHSGGSSRSVATWRTIPTELRCQRRWTASFTNNFHAPALGAAIFGEPEQDHVFQT